MEPKTTISSDFWANFIGGMNAGQFLAAMVMALVGVFLSLLLASTKRDPNSARSPFHFSWSFLISDNAKRLYKSAATTLLVIFISLRFADHLIGKHASMIYALMLGLGLDQVIALWKKKRDAFFMGDQAKSGGTP